MNEIFVLSMFSVGDESFRCPRPYKKYRDAFEQMRTEVFEHVEEFGSENVECCNLCGFHAELNIDLDFTRFYWRIDRIQMMEGDE